MFLNLKNALKIARANHFAIGAFNVFDLEGIKAVANVATELDSPVIIQTTPKAIEFAGLDQLFDMVKNEIRDNKIKAAIHLDHGKDFSIVKKTIDIGYNSVMIDGSSLDFAANVALTRKVVQYAKEYGVNVEAEIGAVGKEGGDLANQTKLTDPNMAREFVEKTGIDAVAVSVGNKHGAPKGEKVNFELLEKISKVVDVPIVMHGSSGLSEGDIKKAISYGVTKFNIDTNLRKAFIEELAENKNNNDPRDILNKIMSAQKEVVKRYVEIFKSDKYDKV